MTDEQRRLTYLRDNVEHLEEEKSTLESLLLTIQSASEEDATEVFRRLRSSNDLATVAQQVQAGQLLSQVHRESPSTFGGRAYSTGRRDHRRAPPLERYERLMRLLRTVSFVDAEEIVRRIRRSEDVSVILDAFPQNQPPQNPQIQGLSSQESEITPGLEADYSHEDLTFGLVKGTGAHTIESERESEIIYGRGQPWTTVSNDPGFIEHLIGLFFAWQGSFFSAYPEKFFRDDMAKGQTRYCSRLLVNAICAAGCLMSDRPQARRDPLDHRTAGLDFYDEAVRLLGEVTSSSLTTTAALYILCQVDSSRGQLSSLWMFSGRSGRTALDINLHLRAGKGAGDGSGDQAESDARLHAFWGCFISDQVTSFTLGRLPQIPINAVTVDLPRVSAEVDNDAWFAYQSPHPIQPSATSTTFNQVAALSKIVNSTLQMFFAPAVSMTGELLLREYQKYLDWYDHLPAIVRSVENAAPCVICLHVYYHAAVLLLFRPFLKATFTRSHYSPREICRNAANIISDLLSHHRRLYGLAGIFTFHVHCLLTACSIHIINVPAIASTNYLTNACNTFQDLIHSNEWAIGALNIIRGLVQKWQIVLPIEAEAALYRNEDMTSEFELGNDPQTQVYRTEKRSQFLDPSTHVLTKRQRTAPKEFKEPANYLFVPFPNQPAPLLGPVHTSTNADVAHNDELNKVATGLDGLNFGDDWYYDPFMGHQSS